MRTFIQLRNGVGYATLVTPNDSPDHTVTPDHTTAIEVFTDNPDQFLKKIYNAETKSWADAPIYIWAELNDKGNPIEIRRSVFEDEIKGPIITEEVRPDWRWIDGEWVKPYIDAEEVAAQLRLLDEQSAVRGLPSPTNTEETVTEE
jgi:hypothetical protein